MMYPYMTLPDETNIVHSEVRDDGRVLVYMEQPVIGGFNYFSVTLPDYTIQNRKGFTEEQQAELMRFVENNAALILELAAEGGFDHAAGF